MSIADAYRGASVLVTGAGGFIGGSIVAALAGVDCRIVRLSRRELPPLAAALGPVEDIHGDPADGALWARSVAGVDAVFHCAAQTSIYVANSDPLSDLRANVETPLRLFQAVREAGGRATVVLASTVTTVGLTETIPTNESILEAPVTMYDLGKLTAERYLEMHCRLGMLRGVTLRLGNAYGPGPSPSSSDRGVLNKIIGFALDGRPVSIMGDGRWIRDYVYIDDIVDAFLLAGRKGEALNGRHFFVCSGEGITIADVFHLAVERVGLATGRAVPITHTEPPAGMSPIEFRNFIGDSRAFSEATGWRARVSLTEGIDRTIAVYRQRRLTAKAAGA
ncbi:MAG: NAD-dependent epimerase/dehydratase family protein [Alphaproteobacteria bacterium]